MVNQCQEIRDKLRGKVSEKLKEDEELNNKGFACETRGGAGNGRGRFWWCRYIIVSRDSSNVKYSISFWLNDYSDPNSLRNNNFDENSGNCHDIRHIGMIQFEELNRLNQSSVNSTASFRKSGRLKKNEERWILPDNRSNNTGRVMPFSKSEPQIGDINEILTDEEIDEAKLNCFVENVATRFICWLKEMQ
jgi:hypothetical protein